jgi:hypothetical protein
MRKAGGGFHGGVIKMAAAGWCFLSGFVNGLVGIA